MTGSKEAMAGHVRVVGFGAIAWAVLTLAVLALVWWVVGLAAFPKAPGSVIVWLSPLGLILLVLLVQAGLAVVGGYGLVQQRAWARVPAMGAAGLALLSFPLGTALGGYALWVLTRPGTQAILDGEPAPAVQGNR